MESNCRHRCVADDDGGVATTKDEVSPESLADSVNLADTLI